MPESTELNETIGVLDRLDRFEVRKRVVEMLEIRGLVEKIEPHAHSVPHGDRSNVPIEPFLTDQWYVDAKTLAKPAIASVREGRTVFVPKNWEKTYFEWMENIQPWCISRQLWWGHRIPAWYGPDGTIFVAHERGRSAGAGRDGRCASRDDDVLDTWFSSALWPFSTLGWPEQTPELKRYYPTSVLVTGFDIIFFWVARMMMMGLHLMEKEPFPTVYIHALVRDEKGAKMSKSKGNVIDPLSLIDQYGADALRFTLAAMAAQGRDIKLATSRVEGYRNFTTKLWNAARFCEINECKPVAGFDPSRASDTLNRWIATEAARTNREVTAAIEAYRFNDAAAALYRFVWNTFCDWYLELAKPVLSGPDGAAKSETRATAAWTLEQILRLLHPFMPFITEELWSLTAEAGRERMLVIGRWPTLAFEDEAAAAEINWLVVVHQRDPLGALRDERAAGSHGAGSDRRRFDGDTRAARHARRDHPADGASAVDRHCGQSARRFGATCRRRGDGRAANRRCDRLRGRARSTCQGVGQGREGDCQGRRQARQSAVHREGGRGSRRGAARAPCGSRRAAS